MVADEGPMMIASRFKRMIIGGCSSAFERGVSIGTDGLRHLDGICDSVSFGSR